MSFSRIVFSEVREDEELQGKLLERLKKMQSRPNHTFSLLYNAWAEAKFGETFKILKPSLDFVETDSGGLQIVTRGATITDEVKDKVYINQGTYSDYAMCFDEIPVKFTGDKSTRQNTDNRWYEPALLEPCARKTGQNIKRQIEIFDSINSATKPIVILQGNDYDSYMRWAEYVLEEIPPEYYHRLGGVAMGAAALGGGTLEDIRRAFFYTQIPQELRNINHLHLLAVGSVTRLIPNLIFLQNGLYNSVYLTYDSTTHTSGMSMGRYYINSGALEFPQDFNHRIHTRMFEDVMEDFDLEIGIREFHQILNSSSIIYKDEYGSRSKFIETYVSTILKSIKNFISHVEACLESRDKIFELSDSSRRSNICTAFHNLYEVQTLGDFQRWEKEVAKYVPTAPIRVKQNYHSLNSFFV